MTHVGKFRISILFWFIVMHVLAALALWYAFAHGYPLRAWVALGVKWLVSMLGISVWYHRYFTHQSFQSRKFVAYLGSVFGAWAAVGSAKNFVKDHLAHHAFADRYGDPHAPSACAGKLRGFFWSHFVWLFYETRYPKPYQTPAWVERGMVLSRQQRWYPLIILGGLGALYLAAGWQGVLLAGVLGTVACWHLTWSVNSLCHLMGFRAKDATGQTLDSRDARNVAFLALLGVGEHYHANHHVRQRSAYLGWRWYDLDPGKWLIWLLGKCRLAWDIRKPFDVPVPALALASAGNGDDAWPRSS